MIDIEIGKLGEIVEEYLSLELSDNQEVDVEGLGMFVDSPNGQTPIISFIKKENQKIIKVHFEEGQVIECASQHIFIQSGRDIYACDLKKGDLIDHKFGSLKVKTITYQERPATCYDISVPYPFVYYDRQGILHHNTLTCATLCKLVEGYGRTFTVVPSNDLVNQTLESYQMIGLDAGQFDGNGKDWSATHTVATWQSLSALLRRTQNGVADDDKQIHDLIQGVNTIIIDECFDGDEQVLTPYGYRKIKDLNCGDHIINYSTATKEFKIDTVVKLHENLIKNQNDQMLELEFDNGVIIKVTENHKFLTDKGWVKAKNLDESYQIINIQSNPNYQNKDSRVKRDSFNIKKFNKNLEKFNQSIRALKITTNEIIFNNGFVITDKNAIKRCKKRGFSNDHSWLEKFDVLYGLDRLKANQVKNQIKSEKCKQGGITVQKFHGEKIQKSLKAYRENNDVWNKGIKTGIIPWNKGLTKDTDKRLQKISEDRKGRNNPMYGHEHSKEYRIRQSEIMKNFNQETRKKVEKFYEAKK